jgi:nucleotide-binding universal stress UspA family protein
MEPQLVSARALARATGALVVVAHINELVGGRQVSHPSPAGDDGLEAGVRDQVAALRGAGVRAELKMHSSSLELARAIADLARKIDVDLIVTRKSRRSALLSLLFGDVSRRLVRLAPCPVLVVS